MTTAERTHMGIGDRDKTEQFGRSVDSMTTQKTGMSVFHMLALASIFASIALFVAGRKTEAIFVGLWPPTFEALKSSTENR
jgi:hypothetical protein